MIKQEHYEVSGHDFIRTYSDSGRFIVGGEPFGAYVEACDPAEFGRTYTEGDVIAGEEATAEDYEAALNRLGVET